MQKAKITCGAFALIFGLQMTIAYASETEFMYKYGGDSYKQQNIEMF